MKFITIDKPYQCPICNGSGQKLNVHNGDYEKCDHTYLIIGKRMWTGWHATALVMFPIWVAIILVWLFILAIK